MMRLITRPTSDVVTLAEARQQCRIDSDVTDHDADLTRYIAAAVEKLDGGGGILGRCLRRQTWELVERRFPGAPVSLAGEPGFPWPYSRAPIRLPLPPTISVTSVKYLDETETEQTMSPTLYRVINSGEDDGAMILPVLGGTWPLTAIDAPDAIRVRFVAGYESAASPAPSPLPNYVPDPIRQAILLTVGSWYVNRSEDIIGTIAGTLPSGALALISPYQLRYEQAAV